MSDPDKTERERLNDELTAERHRRVPPPGGWLCQCGERTQKYSSRCDACQRRAVLEAAGWDEEEAEKQVRRGTAEVRGRRRHTKKGQSA